MTNSFTNLCPFFTVSTTVYTCTYSPIIINPFIGTITLLILNFVIVYYIRLE